MHGVLAPVMAVFPLLLLVAALRDLASYTIPNWISLTGLAAFAVVALAVGLPLPQLALAAGVGAAALALGVGMFALGWIGGGDAKLFAVCGLWLGWSAFMPFLLVTAVAGGALAVALLLARKLSVWLPTAAPAWVRRLATPGENVPYGVAIAVGALVAFPASPLMAAALR